MILDSFNINPEDCHDAYRPSPSRSATTVTIWLAAGVCWLLLVALIMEFYHA
jgi:hypothetical protein